MDLYFTLFNNREIEAVRYYYLFQFSANGFTAIVIPHLVKDIVGNMTTKAERDSGQHRRRTGNISLVILLILGSWICYSPLKNVRQNPRNIDDICIYANVTHIGIKRGSQSGHAGI